MKFQLKFTPLYCLAVLGTGTLLGSCRKSENPQTPGHDKSTKTATIEHGAALLPSNGPISAIHQHVCGFHFYNGEPKRQVVAHHYCSHQNEEVLQCIIYDTDKPDARLIGIEYIISEDLFKSLPEEEKKLWHSHRYEVMSGLLIAPGVPDLAEKEVMKKLVTTYGKTWHTWQVDRGDKLPLGVPRLMMGFTEDGQTNDTMVLQRDQDIGTETAKKRASRSDIPTREVAPGADAWKTGNMFQLSE